MDTASRSSNLSVESRWKVFGEVCPRREVTFFAQVICIYIVIIACIVNLSLDVGESNLWVALLSSCLGYLLPSPSLRNERPVLHHATEQ